LANQLIGRSGIAYVLDQLERILSLPSIRWSICSIWSHSSPPSQGKAVVALPVLVEMGFEGGRTGCRTVEQGLPSRGQWLPRRTSNLPGSKDLKVLSARRTWNPRSTP
jgi:hypothetical protein